MDIEDVSLGKIAVASLLFNALTPYNTSLLNFRSATGDGIDLTIQKHCDALMEWLNDWGCRNLPKAQHKDVASNSILRWYQVYGTSLFSNEKPLWDLKDGELEIAVRAYGSLRDETGALRVRGGRKQKVHIGPTAASKVLFALRPKALMPWDAAMRSHFECDGSADSYFSYLLAIKCLMLHIRNLCQSKGFQIDDLPKKVGRTGSTVLELVNEYIWVTVTREVKLPSSDTLTRWASLG